MPGKFLIKIANIFFRVPTSAFEKIVTLTSSTQLIHELLDILNDIFTYTESNYLKDLIKMNKVKIFVILWKMLDLTTKKDFKIAAFNFLLKVIDSFDELDKIEKEYIMLFNFALDNPTLRGDQKQPAYHFQLVQSMNSSGNHQMYNEYTQNLIGFQELAKAIFDSSHANRYEDVMKEILNNFLIFYKKKTTKQENWFQLFKRTWMEVYFNPKNSEENSKVGVFEEVKQKGFTKNFIATVENYLRYN